MSRLAFLLALDCRKAEFSQRDITGGFVTPCSWVIVRFGDVGEINYDQVSAHLGVMKLLISRRIEQRRHKGRRVAPTARSYVRK